MITRLIWGLWDSSWSSHPEIPITPQLGCCVKSHDKLDTLYLHLHKTRWHHTRQDDDLQWEVSILKTILSFDHVTSVRSLNILKILYFYYQRTSVQKSGMALTYESSSPRKCLSRRKLFSVLTLCQHCYKISMPYLVPVPSYWTWPKTAPQKNPVFLVNLL